MSDPLHDDLAEDRRAAHALSMRMADPVTAIAIGHPMHRVASALIHLLVSIIQPNMPPRHAKSMLAGCANLLLDAAQEIDLSDPSRPPRRRMH